MNMNIAVKDWKVKPESIEPADCNCLKEDGDEEREAGRVVLQKVEDVEPALEVGNGMSEMSSEWGISWG